MLFKFGLDIIKNNKITSVAIVVQLAISIVLMNFSIAMFNYVSIRINTISNFDHSKTLYYMNKSSMNNEDLKVIKSKLNDSEIEAIYNCGFVNPQDGINIYACAYGNRTSEQLSFKMKKGVWYESDKQSGIINAVAYEDSDFDVGDIYETNLYNKEQKNMKSVKIRITGIVDNKCGVLDDSMATNYLDANSLFENVYYDSIATNNLFLFNYNDLKQFNISLDELYLESDMFIYSDSSETDIYIQRLSDYGNTSSFQTVLDNSNEELAKNLHTIFPMSIGVLFTGVMGAECLIILNNLKNRRRFAVFYICGMKWSDSIKICVIQLSFLLVLTCSFAFIFFDIIAKNNLLDFNDIVMFDTNNIFITLSLLAIVYLISILTTKFMTTKISPKDCLKNE